YRTHLQTMLKLAEAAGAERSAATARIGLADAALLAGDVEGAIVMGRAAVAASRTLNLPAALGTGLSNLCAALLLAGRLEDAAEIAAQALAVLRQCDMGRFVFTHLALIAACADRSAMAAQLLGCADAWYAANQNTREPNEARLEALAVARLDA